MKWFWYVTVNVRVGEGLFAKIKGVGTAVGQRGKQDYGFPSTCSSKRGFPWSCQACFKERKYTSDSMTHLARFELFVFTLEIIL